VDVVDREPVVSVLERDGARLWRVLSAGTIHRTSLAQSEWGELAGGLECFVEEAMVMWVSSEREPDADHE
jgi:hypothetical protein